MERLRQESLPMPSPVRFAAVRKMLEDAGWTLARIRGHHHVFTKPGRRSLPIVVARGKVRPVYVKLAEKACQDEAEGEARD